MTVSWAPRQVCDLPESCLEKEIQMTANHRAGTWSSALLVPAGPAGWRQLQTTVWKPLCDSLEMTMCRHMVSSPLKEVFKDMHTFRQLSETILCWILWLVLLEGQKLKRRGQAGVIQCLKLCSFKFCLQKALAWSKLSPRPVYSCLSCTQQKGKALTHRNKISSRVIWPHEITATVQSLLDGIVLLLAGILEHQK